MARGRHWPSVAGITLVEVLIALTILSTLLLPIGMFLVEYLRGSDSLGDFHQVMNLLEEKMEVALAQPFHRLPVGTSENGGASELLSRASTCSAACEDTRASRSGRTSGTRCSGGTPVGAA